MTLATYGCLGNSITYGYGATDPDHAYPVRAGVPRIGYPGQALTIAIWWDSMLVTFPDEIQQMLAAGVGIVVTEIGINDLNVNQGITDADMEAGYHQLQVMGAKWDIRVILSTITPWGANRPGNTPAMAKQRTRLNTWIRTHKYHVDYAHALGGSVMLPKYDSGDQLHPNNKGHKAMADCLTAFIAKHRFKA